MSSMHTEYWDALYIGWITFNKTPKRLSCGILWLYTSQNLLLFNYYFDTVSNLMIICNRFSKIFICYFMATISSFLFFSTKFMILNKVELAVFPTMWKLVIKKNKKSLLWKITVTNTLTVTTSCPRLNIYVFLKIPFPVFCSNSEQSIIFLVPHQSVIYSEQFTPPQKLNSITNGFGIEMMWTQQ